MTRPDLGEPRLYVPLDQAEHAIARVYSLATERERDAALADLRRAAVPRPASDTTLRDALSYVRTRLYEVERCGRCDSCSDLAQELEDFARAALAATDNTGEDDGTTPFCDLCNAYAPEHATLCLPCNASLASAGADQHTKSEWETQADWWAALADRLARIIDPSKKDWMLDAKCICDIADAAEGIAHDPDGADQHTTRVRVDDLATVVAWFDDGLDEPAAYAALARLRAALDEYHEPPTDRIGRAFS